MTEQQQYPTREQAYEIAAAALDSDHLTQWERAAVDAVLALFPQPTPSAEISPHDVWEDGYDTGWSARDNYGDPDDEEDYGNPYPTTPAAPPSIAEQPTPSAEPVTSEQAAEQDWRQERADKITWPRKGLLLCPECNAEPWTDCENCKGRGYIDPSTIRDVTPPPA